MVPTPTWKTEAISKERLYAVLPVAQEVLNSPDGSVVRCDDPEALAAVLDDVRANKQWQRDNLAEKGITPESNPGLFAFIDRDCETLPTVEEMERREALRPFVDVLMAKLANQA